MSFLRLCASATATAIAVVAPSGLAHAQTAPDATVETYLCKFAGKCDGASPEIPEVEVTKDAPATKGFRLARKPQAATTPTTAAPATRGFRVAAPVARTAPARSPAVAARRAPARGPAAVAPRAETRNSVPAGTRADLSIGFKLGSDDMTSIGVWKARVFAQSLIMPELQSKRFRIEGHTDSIGSASSNRDLSRRRAQSVADYLVAQGVDRNRLEVLGVGSTSPLPGLPSSDPDNRRVEAELLN